MKKLEKFSSFDEMKDNSKTGTVSVVVVMERYKKFESFIHFLRSVDQKGESHSKAKTLSFR
ncbi:hypothetical protein [Dyadobacter frigoris]|uniref:Uncharacterized protein n=1 Tax=Dyadobacter frigoris TaxID=2576211 RepID=A0A4U6DB69_9BACT|nr:hypothetical protein [Dyadobacter frigoris]TKT94096.1 hypothetical protein FDK13_02480 [Dyadobacter frigoris]GLU50693.1 hypothetical protein Dfri01_01540 [Dyadobacter frigoris]